MQKNFEKVPIPPTSLFLPISFWAEILRTMDKKVEIMTKTYGFGKVDLSIKVHNGKIAEVVFNDEVKVRDLVEKANPLPET